MLGHQKGKEGIKCEFKGEPKPDLDGVGQAGRLHGGSGFYSFNKPLIPCSVPGPVMGSGASGKWKVSGSVICCPVPREACMAFGDLDGGGHLGRQKCLVKATLLILDAGHGNWN